ncbi:MAG TPA: signal peptidase I [Candidatus Scatomonas pullistercoris]|uniref:Signal peptidase I n=2 Tax=Lachnospiraceae TaxID=186803 RepID=A0A9D2J8V4_9FIRM|nr:signal peptidase I [Eubacterium sp. An3]CVI72360.1 Signal peptidase I W [Eubacteriaceae bacterium CHKCI004]HIV24427.1 signal peptidase I [Candidatus Scatomonas pullistercoris]HIZ39894.1 signal peptidase I [Candidatus Anaerobutyricum stercoris]
MNRFYVICRGIVKIFTGVIWGLLFGTFFLSGVAFLAGRQIYYETSDSMSPVIEKGSLLFVKEEEEYEPGDIVAFYAPYGGQVICVTHRIVDKVQENAYITKGDANDREDRLIVRKEQIFGVVTEYIPYFGYICFFIQRNSTFLLFFFVFSLLWKG